MTNLEISERIQQEITEIKIILEQINKFKEPLKSQDGKLYETALVNALSLNLHSFYTAIERIFEL